MPKLGKLPAVHDDRDLLLSRYLDLSRLPTPPAAFGHEDAIGEWGMLGNDRYGDCVLAGAAHETMVWNALAGRTVTFDDAHVLADYGAVTGFDPATGAHDEGTDVRAAAKYRRKVGVADSTGTRHRIGGFVSLRDDVLELLAVAAWLFDGVGIGVQFPRSAMSQFDAGEPWDLVEGSPIEGGHYVPLEGRLASGNWRVVTWGRVQEVTPRFLASYCDEAFAYLTRESLVGGRTPEGFDAGQLRADLHAIG